MNQRPGPIRKNADKFHIKMIMTPKIVIQRQHKD